MRALVVASVFAVLAALGCSGSDEGEARPTTSAGSPGGGSVGAAGSPGVSGSVGMGGTPSVAGSPGGGSVGQGGTTPTTGGTGPVAGDGKSHVISWVSRYWVDDAKQQLSGNFGMADGLSYLALQFWRVDGAEARLSDVSEENVNWFRDWGKQHNVKVLLCVHNDFGDSWNWGEGVRAFKDNKDAFVQSIASQVQSRNLDGVDVDIEGIVESTPDDQASYVAFMQALSAALKPMGKTLTLASFHGQWNAPNYNWWGDLLPVVDGITSMGYEQSGMDTDYQDLVDHAVAAPEKLMIGVPSYKGTWPDGAGNHTALEHLSWIQNKSKAGVAIWEAGLRAPEWQQPAVWQQLKTIKSR
jgi:hypothetical protein